MSKWYILVHLGWTENGRRSRRVSTIREGDDESGQVSRNGKSLMSESMNTNNVHEKLTVKPSSTNRLIKS